MPLQLSEIEEVKEIAQQTAKKEIEAMHKDLKAETKNLEVTGKDLEKIYKSLRSEIRDLEAEIKKSAQPAPAQKETSKPLRKGDFK